jgi:PleD family two-component response regulator
MHNLRCERMLPDMDRTRILILDDERSGVQHLHDALSSQHDLRWCRNINEAMDELAEAKYDLIICSVHLIHESMFDFLHQVKDIAEARGIPFVCFRAVDTQLGRQLDAPVEHAARLLGATAYIVVETDAYDSDALRRNIESKLAPFIGRRK